MAENVRLKPTKCQKLNSGPTPGWQEPNDLRPLVLHPKVDISRKQE